MGDMANMTSVHGEVDGHRLLRWLRRRLADEKRWADESAGGRHLSTAGWHTGRADLLQAMADDLEQELSPPDYPDDDDDGADLDDRDTGPCDACAARSSGEGVVLTDGGDLRTCPDCGARHNAGSHVEGCCPACVGRRILALTDDGVKLDDTALTGGTEEERDEPLGTILYRRRGILFTIAPWPEHIANPHGYSIAVIRGGEVVGGAADGAAVFYGMQDGLWDEEEGG